MIPEPIKRKYNFTNGEPPKNQWWYTEDQIKAACKWLEHLFFKDLGDGSLGSREDITSWEALDYIKEAFEDVYKQ